MEFFISEVQEMQVLLTLAPQSESWGIRKLVEESGTIFGVGEGVAEKCKRRRNVKLTYLYIYIKV